MNVLFLSVSTGGGHIKAAEALKEAVEARYPFSRNHIIDFLKYINPVIDRLVVGGYLTAIRTRPYLYRKLYELSEANDNICLFSKAVNNLFSYKMNTLISETEPSLIVCTHPFPLQMLSILKKKKSISTPLVAILTDYVTHNFWVHKHVDAYIVANDSMKRQMIERGIPEESVFSYGIPVSGCFLKRKNKNALRTELGLRDKTTILVMGGSLGLGSLEKIFNMLMSVEKDIQTVIITGENTRVKSNLETYQTTSKKEVKVLSYTDRVSDYMDVSDLLITKPGGMTISEALVKELPTILVSPIPGQEEGNASFLSSQGAAIKLDSIEELHSRLEYLLDNNLKLQQLKNASRLLAKPNASRDILQLLEQLVYRSSTEKLC